MNQLVLALQQNKSILEWILDSAGALNLLAFIGVFFAWYLNRRNEREKIKYEERKQLKKILFVMLEIRRRIVIDQKIKIVSKTYTKTIISQISNETGDSLDEDSQNQMNSMLVEPLFQKIFSEMISSDEDLEQRFNNCIDELSEINPVLCFEINGKQNIRKSLANWSQEGFDYAKDILDLDELNPSKEEKQLTEKVNSDITDGVIEHFDEILIKIADSISKKTKKDVEVLLNDREDEDKIEEEFKENLQEMLAFVEKGTTDSVNKS